MSDASIHETIEQLVAEEHKLWNEEASGHADDSTRKRLQEIKVSLDRMWDLLHQRQGLRDAGANPDDAEMRSRETVEKYLQ